jgi:glycosyltransferase involved in cell wall biosynthesis
MKKILVIGQTPPPYGGQALMIKYMLDYNQNSIKYYHVRMMFSREMNERGRLSMYKIKHLVYLLSNIIYLKFKHKINIIYYPPSNSPKISVYRDMIILMFTRFLFKKTIFHFHAAGISEEYDSFPRFLKWFIYRSLRSPDLSISSSKYNPKDGEFLLSKRDVIVPLGIPELIDRDFNKTFNNNLAILFMGLLNSTKGEGYLLEALNKLKKDGIEVNLNIAGKFETQEYEEKFFGKVKSYGLTNQVRYLGVITGETKMKAFRESDIFCFPSFFVSESFGIVLLEAMQFKLPIIATKWRGIQSVVKDSCNGFLVDIKNSDQIFEKIRKFHLNRDLLKEYGDNSRAEYDNFYTLEEYMNTLNNEFIKI